jgi:3-hydroxyacyl-CoA dehydrogenase
LDFPPGASYFDAQFEHIAAAYPGLLAPPAIARCVQAAVALPFDDGLRFERARFRELEAQQQSKDLRAAFFAERAR